MRDPRWGGAGPSARRGTPPSANASLSIRLLPLAIAALLAVANTADSAHATTQTFDAVKDTWVWSGVPDNNIGSTTTAEVGRTVSKSGTVVLKRGLLHFDLAALPADATLTTATLRLFIERTSADPLTLDLTVWRLQTGFVEGDGTTGVTWNTQPAVEPTPADTGTMNTLVGSWFEMDVTAVVLAARGSPDPTNVWLRVAPTDETTIELRDFAFRTKEYGTGAQAAELLLDYEVPTPTYTPTPAPPPTSTPVDTPTATPTSTSTPSATLTHTATATPTESGLPPDPASIAPPLDRSVATDVYAATTFLYTGPTPIQTGVAPGAIEPRRAAVVRGQVRQRDGSPLPGVTVRILDHTEWGSTLTRADGVFDLVVNGGGPLTVDYTKDQLLPAQRQVEVPWQSFVWAPDIVMIQHDGPPTVVTFPDPGNSIQVVRGIPIPDPAFGVRQATILILPGTTAQLVPAGGLPTPTPQLTIRATEYTVGDTGADAMPAALPPTTAYTYAVELSAVEAPEGTDVQFSQPVFFYIENFLGFPVGSAVPTGWYDRRKGVWVPLSNGQVIGVLSVSPEGVAELDTDGDGVADNGLAITLAEREQLGSLYVAGQTLWRVPLTHFSTIDMNWPSGPALWPYLYTEVETPKQDDPECAAGSVIECENQSLGETLPVVGTPSSLRYRSDRVLGRETDRTLTIRVPDVPAEVRKVRLFISVAGRLYRVALDPAPEIAYQFVWDGLDAYGRAPQGAQSVIIYVWYDVESYYGDPVLFGQASGSLSAIATRRLVPWFARRLTQVLSWDALPDGLGGWSLSSHHAYDPSGRILYLGTGERRSAPQLAAGVIKTVAGNGTQGFSGDGGAATAAALRFPAGVALAPDGSLYIADYLNNRVRRVAADGTITTVAGTGGFGAGGDNGPATAAQVPAPRGMAVAPDGSLYIAASFPSPIRRVDASGIITSVAGNQSVGFWGDGGPATSAALGSERAIAVSPDGVLYIADTNNQRIRRVGPDGIIWTVAGTGAAGFGGDGGPATAAQLSSPSGIAVGPNGTLYIADTLNNRIRRLGPDGIIETVAGNSGQGFSGDFGLATDAALNSPRAVAVDSDGAFWIADTLNNRIRRVGTDGIIHTIAGSGAGGYSGDNGLPRDAGLTVEGVALGPDGNLYLADKQNHRIRAVGLPLPSSSFAPVGDEILIPSADAREVYVFSALGRHLATLDALTGATRYTFGYDGAGRLTAVTDGDGNQTSVVRDAQGNPIKIVGPYGQETLLELDGNGYLARVTNPNGEDVRFTSSSTGLLETLTDARGHVWSYEYEDRGRLIRDEDPAAGFTALARTALPEGYEVERTTAENRHTRYRVERLVTGEQQRTTTLPDATQRVVVVDREEASRETTIADGTVHTRTEGPDPRFSMQAPVAAEEITTAGSASLIRRTTRLADRTDETDPLSLTRLTETITVNGRPFARVFDVPTRTFTLTTPETRTSRTTIDAQGRVLKTEVTGLHPIRREYDARGRLTAIKHGPDPDTPETRVTAFAYKNTTDVQNGYLDTVTDAANRTARFTYDGAGRVLTQTFLPGTPDERVIGYGYDGNGNLTVVTPPNPGQLPHAFTYTVVDLALEYAPPQVSPPLADPRTTYTYNLDRDLTEIARPDGATIAFDYETSGRLGTVVLQPGGEARAYGYDLAGRRVSLSGPDASLSFSYEGRLLTAESWTWTGPPAGVDSVTRSYNDDFRLAALQVNQLAPIGFSYDGDGLLTQAGSLAVTRDSSTGLISGTILDLYTGNVTDGWTYSLFGEPATYRADVSGTPVYTVSFDTRDRLGRLTKKTETLEGQTTVYEYAYDAAGRLSEVKQDSAVVSAYTYDANGNRLSRTTTTGTVAATYDAQDRLTSYATATYAYTDNGELASKTTGSTVASYIYDALGNLRTVTSTGGPVIEYLVDGRNRRIGKKVDGVLQQRLLYKDQLEPVAELGPDGTVVAQFVYGTRASVPDYLITYDPLSGQEMGTYRIIADQLGSPRLVVNVETGAVAQRMDYDEFGAVLTDTAPGFQPFGFAGGLYDRDTGLVRFGARDYDPETGRWTAKDPIRFGGRDLNLYGYVLGNPVGFSDRTGLTLSDVEAAWSLVTEALGSFGQYEPSFLLPGKDLGVDPATGDEIFALYDPVTGTVTFDNQFQGELNKEQLLTLLTTAFHEWLHAIPEAGRLDESDLDDIAAQNAGEWFAELLQRLGRDSGGSCPSSNRRR